MPKYQGRRAPLLPDRRRADHGLVQPVGVDELQLVAPTRWPRSSPVRSRSGTTRRSRPTTPASTCRTPTIIVAHRADGSGTTSNFTKYLDAAAPDTWTLGSGDTVNWPSDTQAGNGNAGVAQIVNDTDGAIGYVDLADADGGRAAARARSRTRPASTSRRRSTAPPAAVASAEVEPDLTYNPLNAAGADATRSPRRPTSSCTKQSDDDGETVKGWINFVLPTARTLAERRRLRAAAVDAGRRRRIAQLDQLTIG